MAIEYVVVEIVGGLSRNWVGRLLDSGTCVAGRGPLGVASQQIGDSNSISRILWVVLA
jgi:hypothetical protein